MHPPATGENVISPISDKGSFHDRARIDKSDPNDGKVIENVEECDIIPTSGKKKKNPQFVNSLFDQVEINPWVLKRYKLLYLHELLTERDSLDTFAFVDPATTYNCERLDFERLFEYHLEANLLCPLFSIIYLPLVIENSRDLGSRIYCPCRKCENRYLYVRLVVRQHLHDYGFFKKYRKWDKHGEPNHYVHPVDGNQNGIGLDSYMEDDMVRLVQEALGAPNVGTHDQTSEENSTNPNVGANEPTKKFLKLLEDANLPLYPGSKRHTALSYTVRLLQAKVLHGWIDKSFKTLLEIAKESMPEGVQLPNSYYEAQKLTKDLGFTYETVDACPNSCMLFRNEDINLDECRICKTSRWKDNNGSSNDVAALGKRKVAKQARYFPLKPRLQRLFMSSKTAKLMRWHGEERTDDGVFRHPADSIAWKDFAQKHTNFSRDIRNVRLGLASDVFNSFRSMNIVHSAWPIILVPYNLPPMLCMKQPFIFLYVLIDGPKAPGDKIDVYMQPLIEELKELYEDGVETFDAFSNEMFKMHAELLWTINDFPAYANLSGWSTKGEFACPSCNSESGYQRLKFGKKASYMTHRRWLPYDHKYRADSRSFNGNTEYRRKPKTLSGADLLAQLESNGVLTEYKREDLERRKVLGVQKPDNDPLMKKKHNWKKKSIFYELPYWKDNLIRHNLDVMHIEKNICDNVLFTILGVAGKSKDNLNSRRDLELMGIREQYHLKRRESGTEYADPAEFEMNNKGKDMFFSALSGSRMPDGATSNIARRVRLHDRSIGGLKSHDNHILLQQLIPLFIRSSLPENVVQALIDLADEALIAGAVIFRWIYPIERYLLTLKEYVWNRACPEALMAKGYLMEECMNFCTQYLNDVESKFNRPARKKNDDDINKGKDFVINLQRTSSVLLSEEVIALSNSPSPSAKRLTSYNANGFFFRVKSLDNHRSTQNSGVTLQADKNFSIDSSPYYGRLTDIIKISYGIKLDHFKFPLVNFKRLLYKNDCIGDEPFILASQAHQLTMKKRKIGRPRTMSEYLSSSSSQSSSNSISSSQQPSQSSRLPPPSPSPPPPPPPPPLALPSPPAEMEVQATVESSKGQNKGIS
ncbi:uncharacterized protein LOC121051221 [Rosa chinensis]|uniref:uncharacterized protein LOC121051221 n=1 Tax=Rosa chinensis TaxID=74649 RepID=UPI001AD929DA|nr:uncharacterized protein LOC121051221 [Rosa chinensis]